MPAHTTVIGCWADWHHSVTTLACSYFMNSGKEIIFVENCGFWLLIIYYSESLLVLWYILIYLISERVPEANFDFFWNFGKKEVECWDLYPGLPGWKANMLTTESKCDHILVSAQYFTWRYDPPPNSEDQSLDRSQDSGIQLGETSSIGNSDWTVP